VSAFDLIAFDADDTLWHNLIHFQKAETEFGHLMQDHMPAAEATALLMAKQAQTIPIYGFGAKTFTLTMIEAAMDISGNALDSALLRKLIETGQAMLTHEIELLPHAEDTLKALHGKHPLIMITKGDLFHQEKKVKASGLAHYFDGIEIVSDKKPETFAKIAKRYGTVPERLLMAGNSIKSDILPVIAAGGTGVYVPFEIIWEHEHEEVPEDLPRFFEIAHLGELENLIKGF
jgi:putative hydrolase of the HAD superfamily